MKNIIGFIVCLCFIGCFSQCSDKNDVMLNNVENMMCEKPDSALILLQSIDKNTLNSERQKALYALLLSQAFDKNYIDITNDSIISVAVDFFVDNNNGNTNEKFLSLYYLGRIYYNAGTYDKSILAYSKAEQLIEEIEDNFTKGLLFTQLGFIYEQYYDYTKALDAYKQSYGYYELANKLSHRNYAKYLIASMYRSSPNTYVEAENLLIDIITNHNISNNSALISSCICELIIHYVETEQINKATEVFNQFKNTSVLENQFSKFYCSVALLFAYNNNFKESKKYLDTATNTAKTRSDSVLILNNSAIIAKLNNNYNLAYQLLVKSKKMEVPNIRKRLEHPILTIQKDFLEKELEFNKYKQKAQLLKYLLIGTGLLLLCISIFLYLRYIIKCKEHKLSKYSDIIIELQQKQLENKSIVSELLHTSFKDQFKFLNCIGDAVFNQTKDLKGQKTVFNEINNIVKQFKRKKTFNELENLVNKYCDNVMQLLRTEFPNFKDEDYRQLCYHYAGFSGKLISILLDINQSNVYLRKSRLKERIEQSNTQNIDILLRHLS